ncbi:MAG: hypothetical protein ABI781_13150, partial [Burkholderiales bacterium]
SSPPMTSSRASKDFVCVFITQDTRLIVNRDRFLGHLVARTGGHQFTVRDVIRFEAHVDGAAHAGAPKTDEDHAMVAYSEANNVAGQAANVRQLRAIARVTLKALEPLKQMLLAQT